MRKMQILEEKFRRHLASELFIYSNIKVTSALEMHIMSLHLLYNELVTLYNRGRPIIGLADYRRRY